MRFFVSYDDGYVVTHLGMCEDGYMRHRPLRKFKEQGDAFVFRDTDCPQLTDMQIKHLIKRYDAKKMYQRINGRRFVVCERKE